MRTYLFAAATAAALGAFAAPHAARAETSCADLAKTALPHAEVTAASVQKAGQNEACKIEVTSRPTKDSDIRIEVWIPMGTAWNGKFVQVGNGGFAGQVPSRFVQAMAGRGYAAAGTDDGHQSKEATSAAWALGHPEKIVDFGWRALKETTDISKALIAAQKGLKPKTNYFYGCSDGGREALMEAQRFPTDFDGIVAGAPANYMSQLFGLSAAQQQALSAPGGYLDAPARQLLESSVLKQCADGGKFIRDPAACHFDPAKLQCKKGETEGCLSVAQVRSAKVLYEGRRDPRTGKIAFPGYSPGAEAAPGSWPAWITGKGTEDHPQAAGYQFSSNAFKYFAFDDPSFDMLKMNMGGQLDRAQKKIAAEMDSASPNLTAFKKHGGKLIQYHGWNDPAIPPRSSILYYEDVTKTMGDPSSFYKLYLVPGMLHCGGGSAPTNVDWLSELDAWVMEKKAPAAIKATAAPNGQGDSQTLCPYPAVAHKTGDAWSCKAPTKGKKA